MPVCFDISSSSATTQIVPLKIETEAKQRLTVAHKRLHTAIRSTNAELEVEGGGDSEDVERLENALALYWWAFRQSQ